MARPEFRCRHDLWNAFTTQAATDQLTATRALEALITAYADGHLDPGPPTTAPRGQARQRINLHVDRDAYDRAMTRLTTDGWRRMTPLVEGLALLYTTHEVTLIHTITVTQHPKP
ncbi:hypothetical protein ACIPRL_07955 [Streptomyces sp. NPDC090085]|uniref:hypothetical protein n=1 Tax=Streptomyces sp. NPDC090085 TaxID=3365943 RepID=UPI003806FD95